MVELRAPLAARLAGLTAMAGQRRRQAPNRTRASASGVLLLLAAAAYVVHASIAARDGRHGVWVFLLICPAAAAVTLAAVCGSKVQTIVALAVVGSMSLAIAGLPAPGRAVALKAAVFALVGVIVLAVLGRTRWAIDVSNAPLHLDPLAEDILAGAATSTVRVIAVEPDELDSSEYPVNEVRHRLEKNFAVDDFVMFLEVTVVARARQAAPSHVYGENRYGYRVLRIESATTATAVAAVLLRIRDRTGRPPHIYFRWPDRSPHADALRYLLHGDGAVVALTRAKLREAEPDPSRRPIVHVD